MFNLFISSWEARPFLGGGRFMGLFFLALSSELSPAGPLASSFTFQTGHQERKLCWPWGLTWTEGPLERYWLSGGGSKQWKGEKLLSSEYLPHKYLIWKKNKLAISFGLLSTPVRGKRPSFLGLEKSLSRRVSVGICSNSKVQRFKVLIVTC